MNVVAYYRVSTQRQADSGLGLEAQKESVERFCEANGHTIVASFVENGVSGKSDIADRPALVESISAVKELKCDALVVARLDRLSRDMFVMLTVERVLSKVDARVVSSSGEGTEEDTPQAKLIKNILAAVAENEGAMISMRTKAALKAAKARGITLGRTPSGFVKTEEGKAIPGPDFWIIARIVYLRRKGSPLRHIVHLMNQPEVMELTGRKYSLKTIQNICARWRKGTRTWFTGIKSVDSILPNMDNPPWMRQDFMPVI